MSGKITKIPGALVRTSRYLPSRWAESFAATVAERLRGKVALQYQRLIEPQHPLHQLLQRELPGVYRHSLLVGTAAAIAAHKIGAAPDRARVIGYFHDVGKIVSPNFFSGAVSGNRMLARELDNQEKLSILLYHARASAAYIRENFPDVPEEIVLGVEEHHGLMRTFARLTPRLQEQLEREHGSGWEDKALRYPGPRLPQTSEAALVMLADGVEALLATLYTGDRLAGGKNRAYFRKIVSQVFSELEKDGQFRESGLSAAQLREAEVVMMWPFFRFYNGLDLVSTPEHLRKHNRG